MVEKARKRLDQVLGGRRWRAPEARVVVRSFEESGLGAREFAQKYHIKVERLVRWRARLNGQGEQRADAAGADAGAPPEFVPVQLAGMPQPEVERSGVGLLTPDGWRVVLSRGFDDATLRRVISVLGPC